jgi:hypothetical protein
MLFSGCGFADDLRETAGSKGDVVLLTLEDMYEPLALEAQE